MRAEKLVGAAGEEVAVDVLDVDQPVRCIVHGVDEEECIWRPFSHHSKEFCVLTIPELSSLSCALTNLTNSLIGLMVPQAFEA